MSKRKKDAVDDVLNDHFSDEPGEYVSESSIDRPPREPKEGKGKQETLFNEAEHEQSVEELLSCALPDKFKFKLTLAVQATSGNSNTHQLPIAAGEAPRERIEEILMKQIGSEYFLRRLRAVVGDPLSVPIQKDLSEVAGKPGSSKSQTPPTSQDDDEGGTRDSMAHAA